MIILYSTEIYLYSQQQKLQQQKSQQEEQHEDVLPAYHIVFSTSCTDQQNWESYIFFYHCYRVRQHGNITRIVSGCSTEYVLKLQNFHNQYIIPYFGNNYHLHFTPDYSRISLENNKFAYKYMNKPYGLRDWFKNGPLQLKLYNSNKHIPSNILDGIVFLLDPDMILLRPLTHDFTNEEVLFIPGNDSIRTKIVKHGYPMSQQDGYLNNEWMSLNFSYIFENYTSSSSSSSKMSSSNTTLMNIRTNRPPHREGPIFWNSGPPYIATVKDMYDISRYWVEFAPAVHRIHPKLFAEMYGYIMSTIALNLPHTFIRSLVVSTTVTRDREGWSYIDQLPDDIETIGGGSNQMCQIAHEASTISWPLSSSKTTPLPVALHYCSRYVLGQNFFSKYRLKKNIMNCQSNLLKPINNLNGIYPNNNNDIYDSILPPKADGSDLKSWKPINTQQTFTKKTAKREAFMLCSLTAAVNIALKFLKLNTSYCTSSIKQIDNNNNMSAVNDASPIIINLNETYTVYNDPFNY